MSSPLLRRACAALTSVALAGTVALLVPTSAEAATQSRAYGGSAYGSTAKFGTLVNSGRTANTPFCTTRSGSTRTNTSAAVDLKALGSIGVTETKVQSARSGSTQSTTTTTETADVKLGVGVGVGGVTSLVEADAVVATAKVTFNGSSYVRTGSTRFVGLRVGGKAVANLTPAKNSKLELLGIGTVFLNEQSTSDAFDNYTQSVTGLRLVVSTGTPAQPAGQATIAFARASLHSPKFARAYGNAYATQVTVGSVLRSGPTALVDLPCGGTSGKTRTNNIAEVNVTGVLNAGAAKTTGKSTDSPSATTALTTATIADVDLLKGLITADAITARASTIKSGSKRTRTSAGTTIVDLKIDGKPIEVTGAANQRIDIAVGTVYIRGSSLSDTGLQVYALQLVLTKATGGLPVNTVINIGAAQSGVV